MSPIEESPLTRNLLRIFLQSPRSSCSFLAAPPMATVVAAAAAATNGVGGGGFMASIIEQKLVGGGKSMSRSCSRAASLSRGGHRLSWHPMLALGRIRTSSRLHLELARLELGFDEPS